MGNPELKIDQISRGGDQRGGIHPALMSKAGQQKRRWLYSVTNLSVAYYNNLFDNPSYFPEIRPGVVNSVLVRLVNYFENVTIYFAMNFQYCSTKRVNYLFKPD